MGLETPTIRLKKKHICPQKNKFIQYKLPISVKEKSEYSGVLIVHSAKINICREVAKNYVNN